MDKIGLASSLAQAETERVRQGCKLWPKFSQRPPNNALQLTARPGSAFAEPYGARGAAPPTRREPRTTALRLRGALFVAWRQLNAEPLGGKHRDAQLVAPEQSRPGSVRNGRLGPRSSPRLSEYCGTA